MYITRENIQSLLGKTIRWSAPSADGNFPYGGITRIGCLGNDDVPFLGNDEPIVGDDICFAFFRNKGILCFSDNYRYIDFEIYDGINETETKILQQGAYFCMPTDTKICVIKSNALEFGKETAVMHFFVTEHDGYTNGATCIEVDGEIFVTNDWENTPLEREHISDYEWYHNGRHAIMLNGLPRIFV